MLTGTTDVCMLFGWDEKKFPKPLTTRERNKEFYKKFENDLRPMTEFIDKLSPLKHIFELIKE
jgi:hypothetical protein